MRRTLLSLSIVATLALGLTACSGDDGDTASTEVTTNPMDAKAEVRDPNADYGWDRTESDPDILAALLAVAQQIAATPLQCNEAGETPVDTVKVIFDTAHLPVPAATATCTTFDGEDLTFEGFTDEHAKNVFLEAKQELLCTRGKISMTDPSTGRTSWKGIPYLDGGTWIIEPTDNDTRDFIAQQLGLAAHNFCTNAETDPAPPPDLG